MEVYKIIGNIFRFVGFCYVHDMFTASLFSDSVIKITCINENVSIIAGMWIYVFAAAVVVCFLTGEITRNYSQTDKLWSLMPIIYAWLTVGYNPSIPRLWLMSSLVTVWGLRLTYNFSRKGGYSLIPWKGEEDYRWRYLRQQPFMKGQLRMSLFNLLFISFYQHFLMLLFSSPLLVAAGSGEKSINTVDIAAAVMMILFITLETVADNQQYRFQLQKRNIVTKGRRFSESLKRGFLTEGLWSYVRHPNYSAEQAIWISFYFFGVAAGGRLINWSAAGAVLLVLLFLGSTKLTEKISSGKYPDYRDYIKKVPCFVPSLPVRQKSQHRTDS